MIVTADTSTSTKIKNPWLRMSLRLAWAIVFVILAWAYFGGLAEIYQLLRVPCAEPGMCSLRFQENPDPQAKVPTRWPGPPFGHPDRLPPEQVDVLEGLGLTLESYALFGVIELAIPLLLYLAIGVLVFWQRHDDWLGILVSFTVLGWMSQSSPLMFSFTVHNPLWAWLYLPATMLSLLLLFLFPYIFPSGKIIPRWIGLVLLAGAGGLFLEILFPNLFGTGAVVFVAVPMLGGLASQVYRYRKISTPSQRQQTKWVVYGFVVFVLLQILLSALDFFVNTNLVQTQPPLVALVYGILYDIAGIFTGLVPPLSIAISILRFRLWDVDFVINRTLVYALTTGLLLGVLLAGFFGLRALWAILLGGQQELLAVALPAVFVTLIFNPTRQRLKTLIDQRLYGIRLDYEHIHQQARKSFTEQVAGIGRYHPLELIGRGGMGLVYRARDETRNGWVAIKTIHSDSGNPAAEASARFIREAQAIASLSHPNIVLLYSVEEHQGQPFLVMEYVEGQTIASLLEASGRLSLAQALQILQPLAGALDYAHDKGIVHRDIKPGNILVEHASQRPVLMDFGIARIAALTQMTATGGMVGTLDYIAPEQIQATAEVGPQADIYSLGVMTYQMLTGQVPFQRANPGATIFAHLMEPPPEASAVTPELAPTSSDAIRKAMAKKPEERYWSAGEFIAALGGSA